MKKDIPQGKALRMEGWIHAGKINFLGWSFSPHTTNNKPKLCFETIHTIPSSITEKAQQSAEKLFLTSPLQKGWSYIEFLIDFRRENLIMTNIRVGNNDRSLL